jgi:uncharacterized membrane protein YedE/YeeE
MTKRLIVAWLSGTSFALGLCMAGVQQPRVVLDAFAFGAAWNPSMPLMFLGAFAVHTPIAWLMHRRKAALSGAAISCSRKPVRDAQLWIGAAVFGAGWGLSGVCPAPMVTGALGASPSLWAVIAGYALGLWITTDKNTSSAA